MHPQAGDGAIDEERRNDQQESDGDLADLVLLDANDVDTRQVEHVDSPDRCGHQHDERQGESDGRTRKPTTQVSVHERPDSNSPVVKVWLHSTSDASPPAALLLLLMLAVFSVV